MADQRPAGEEDGVDEPEQQEEHPSEQVPAQERTVTSHGVTYTLKPVEAKTNEEDEDALIVLRAKLFRFAKEEKEWKERGTGEVKLLKHKTTGKIRVLMRRDKTLKICANHYVAPQMDLQPNIGSDKSWVYSVHADYSDDIPSTNETLAIRFANPENAQKFKTAFEEAKEAMKNLEKKE